MNKKILTLGTISTLVPLATVVSCGIKEPTITNIKYRNELTSQETMNRIEEIWQKKVIEEVDPGNSDTVAAGSVLGMSLDFILRERVSKSPITYLTNLADQISKTKEFQDILSSPGDGHKTLTSWNMFKYRENGDMTTYPIDQAAKDFIFKNIPSIRSEVYKMAMSYSFLNAGVTTAQYEKTQMQGLETLTDIQNDINPAEFGIVNEAISQHLFGRWELSSDSTNLKTLTPSTPITDAEALANMVDAISPIEYNLFTESKYTEKNTKLILSTFTDAADTVSVNDFGGYKGVVNADGSKGIMTFSKDDMKLATQPDSWKGWLVDGELVTSNIKIFQDADPTTAKLTRLIGLMPIYDTTSSKYTFVGTKWETTERNELIFQLSKNPSVYSKSVLFFTKRKVNPIKLKIINDLVRTTAIDHGFKFINEDE